ncbi:MAG: hypothetical protein A3K12_13520 [Candidatus Rokubacteria bacterium RIFCSPLOWO2_12_FULL_71_19]|nr:MAG: hypothetical protein A3K12_13520 [Candidatus Rokubacteria bacterium RIFCSPLOWO2_12_FULL_71_19]
MGEDRPLLIALNHGIAARNVLQTDLFRELKGSGIRIVLLTPNAEDEAFRRAYGGDNVVFEKMEIDRYREYLSRSRAQALLKTIRWFTLNGNYDITTISDWYEKVHRRDRGSKGLGAKLRNVAEDLSIPVLRRSALLRRAAVALESVFFTPSLHTEAFRKHRPGWALVTSLGFFDFDQYIMREAKRNGAKVVSVILSWDNTSTRGIGGAVPDKVIAWTETMRRELMELHDMDPAKIFVGGVAQFDHYFRDGYAMGREAFLSRFGLSPDRKIIYFATKSPTGFPWNPDIVRAIAEAIREDRFEHPCQLLVRVHPIHFRMRDGRLRFEDVLRGYDEIADRYPHVAINKPTMQSENIAFDMPDTELSDVASILRHADVMVNVFSTMNLEASIFDLPSINASFDEMRSDDQGRARVNVEIDEKQTHNQRLLRTGGTRVARNRAQLIDLVNTYLRDPGVDRAGRQRLVEQECGPDPGKAGRRIANHLLELVRAG